MTSPSNEELPVWAWTEDYDMVVVEGSDFEPLYGLMNRHTGVIEIQEGVFSNAVSLLMTLQDSYETAQEIINEDGSIKDIPVSITLKSKEGLH